MDWPPVEGMLIVHTGKMVQNSSEAGAMVAIMARRAGELAFASAFSQGV